MEQLGASDINEDEDCSSYTASFSARLIIWQPVIGISTGNFIVQQLMTLSDKIALCVNSFICSMYVYVVVFVLCDIFSKPV